MEYGAFVDDFKRVHGAWGMGEIDTPTAHRELTRLRSLVPALVESDREFAESALADFEAELSPEAQDRMARAVAVVSAASAEGGTPEEWIARIEAGMSEVSRIAEETDDRGEQVAILEMNGSLARLLAGLRGPGGQTR